MKTLFMPGDIVQLTSDVPGDVTTMVGIIVGAYEGNYGIEFVILYRDTGEHALRAVITTRPLDWVHGKVLL